MHHSCTYQCAESLTIIDGAGQHHWGVPKVSWQVTVCSTIGQQELQEGRDKNFTVINVKFQLSYL